MKTRSTTVSIEACDLADNNDNTRTRTVSSARCRLFGDARDRGAPLRFRKHTPFLVQHRGKFTRGTTRMRQDMDIVALTTEMARNILNNVAELNACNPNSPGSSIMCVSLANLPSFGRPLKVSPPTWLPRKWPKNTCTISGTTFSAQHGHNLWNSRPSAQDESCGSHASARFCLIL